MIRRSSASLCCAVLVLALSARAAAAAELRIAILQGKSGDARKHQPLLDYLAKKGVRASIVTAPDHRSAAEMFAAGSVDAMLGGSGISATMIIKGLAEPLVRPISADGITTYSAVVIAPKGSPKFDGAPGYFDGKRVIFASLASAGEFYFRSLGPSKPAAALKASSYGAALDALARGQADVAIVKNRVWEAEKAKHPALEQVGGDTGENPDGALTVSRNLDRAVAQQLAAILLGIEKDGSPEAGEVREALKIRGFVRVIPSDFAHTVELLRRAGVTKDFAFSF